MKLDWTDVTIPSDRDEGGWRIWASLDHPDWAGISILHRLTGFGYMETETALVPSDLRKRNTVMCQGDIRDNLDGDEDVEDIEKMIAYGEPVSMEIALNKLCQILKEEKEKQKDA